MPLVAVNVNVRVPVVDLRETVTVTVACTEPVPLNATCAGEMVQLSVGATPLHESATTPVKPLIGDTVIVYVPECPRDTVSADGEALVAKSRTAWAIAAAELP